MFLFPVNDITIRIVKLPKSTSADYACSTESKVNAIHANPNLKQRVPDESLYWQICWDSMHILDGRTVLTMIDLHLRRMVISKPSAKGIKNPRPFWTRVCSAGGLSHQSAMAAGQSVAGKLSTLISSDCSGTGLVVKYLSKS